MTKLIYMRGITAAHMIALRVFDPGKKAGWKVDEAGHIVLQDGNPVYIDANGGELVLGTDTVSRLNGEAKVLRERAEGAEAKLKPFEGIDAAKAKEALETVKDISAGDLIKKGEAERVRNEIKATYDTQIAEKDKIIGEKDTRLTKLVRTTAFEGSKFIKDQIAIPVDMMIAAFGDKFQEIDGKLIAVNEKGEKLVSKKKAGEYAEFDEAISIMVEGYAYKDNILKGNNHNGSGNGGGGNGGGRGRVIPRSEYDAMSQSDQLKIVEAAQKGEATIVDRK